jgi:type IV secretion system protein VirB10
MPNTVSGNKKPHGVSHTFMFAIAALVLGVIAAFFFSQRSQPPAYDSKEFAMNGVNGNWYKRNFATPAPIATPMPTPTAPPRVITPAQIYRARPAATPDMAAQERLRLLMRAMSSDLAVKVDGSNVFEMAQRDPRQMNVSMRPAPQHTIVAWTYLSAILETPISSDHSGDVLARLSEDTRDSVTQTEVLIPAGSVIHGTQHGANPNNFNDKSLTVLWDEIIFPNGAHLEVPNLIGTNDQGSPGLNGQIDKHLASSWGPAVLISAITAGVMLAQTPTYAGYQGYSGEQQATGAFANSLGSRATQQLNQSLMSVRPTITIAAGTPVKILVNHDFVFGGPYQG